MIRRIVLLTAFAVLVPCLAMAGGVSFTTSGSFSTPGLYPISFAGTTVTNFSGSSNLSFGMFTVGKCPTAKCTGSETFTLTITQSTPVPGTGSLTGTVAGTVLMSGDNNLTLTFTSATITIGSTMYSIMFPHSLNFGGTTLNGKIGPGMSVPEPSAQLLLGMGALGLMALATLSRKKMISV